MNFDKLLGDLSKEVLELLLGVFHTGYEFLTSPGALSNSNLRSSVSVPGPLTFFVFAMILFVIELLPIKAMAKGTKIQVQISPSSEEWNKALTKLDAKALLKAAAPFVVIVAAHAWLVTLVFRMLGSQVSFQSVFSAGDVT